MGEIVEDELREDGEPIVMLKQECFRLRARVRCGGLDEERISVGCFKVRMYNTTCGLWPMMPWQRAIIALLPRAPL